MTKTIENLFIYSAIYSSLLPILFFLFYFNKATESKVLITAIIYSVIEFVTNITSDNVPMRTIILLYSIFTIVEYLLFAILLYLLIQNSVVRKILIWVSILFFLFSIIYYLNVHYKLLDSVPIGVETILVLTFAFYFLYQEMDIQSAVLIYQRFSFWIIAGIMIYLAGSFFIYIFANQVTSEIRHDYWVFQNAFTIVKNICFLISILIFIKNKKVVSPKKRVELMY
jgi:hypothetical protein